MRVIRIYQKQMLAVGNTLTLDEQASHHLLRVLRLKVGAAITLFNGNGWIYHGILASLSKNTAYVLLQSQTEQKNDSPLKLHLGQVMAKGDKMDWAVQKAIELGVQCITPLHSERCDVELNSERQLKKQQHWQAIAINAAEQCGRFDLPIVHPVTDLAPWFSLQTSNTALVLDPDGSSSLKDIEIKSPISILIGPEGGLSESEINSAAAQGFTRLKLGPRILRTETAGLAIIASLQALKGDWL